MSVLASEPLPLVASPALRVPLSIDKARLAAAHRLALIGHARVHLVQPTPHHRSTPHATEQSSPSNANDILQKSTLSSVAKRKQRLANSSIPTYARATTHSSPGLSPSPMSPEESQTTTDKSSSGSLSFAPVGVVDMRFLSRQPPALQKTVAQQPKSSSKPSSVSTPTTPPAPLAGSVPKNQRPKARQAGAVPAAAINGKSTKARPNRSIATAVPIDDSMSADNLKKTKLAFLFRPESEQPTRGPYIRFSPMYHYYHPYRNLHREAIKAEWVRLHPVVEAPPPQEEEEVVTPPRRTSGRQKKAANAKGVGKGKGEKGKKAAAGTSQSNEATGTSPPPTGGRRSRAANKAKAPAKGPGKGKGLGGRGPGSKRKRAEFEEEEKQQVSKEEVEPTPPSKRPRRGAAAAAIALSAAQEAEEAGSTREEVEGTEEQDGNEPRQIKRRMRPNARKTAAARAAAMEAKKKKKSTEDGEGDTGENGEEDEAAESAKDDESNSNNAPGGSQKGSPHQIEQELQQEHVNGTTKEEEHDLTEAHEFDEPKPEEKKPTRGRGGKGGRGGGRGRGKRAGTPMRGGRGRGGRGTPRTIAIDHDEPSMVSTPVPGYEDLGSAQLSVVETPTEELTAFIKPKPRRFGSNKALARVQAMDNEDASVTENGVSEDGMLAPPFLPHEGLPAEEWRHMVNDTANGMAQTPSQPEAADVEDSTKIE